MVCINLFITYVGYIGCFHMMYLLFHIQKNRFLTSTEKMVIADYSRLVSLTIIHDQTFRIITRQHLIEMAPQIRDIGTCFAALSVEPYFSDKRPVFIVKCMKRYKCQ